MHPDVKAMIEHYHFTPLPAEGTLFLSTYRSTTELEGGRPYGTAIVAMYCDEPPSFSRFHRLPVDEVWHFYAGDPMRLVLLFPDGSSRDVILGNEPVKGQLVQFVIPAGAWQAGHMLEGGRYSLFGCTMAPGFTDDMYEGGTREQLLAAHPDRSADIERFAAQPSETNMPKGFAR